MSLTAVNKAALPADTIANLGGDDSDDKITRSITSEILQLVKAKVRLENAGQVVPKQFHTKDQEHADYILLVAIFCITNHPIGVGAACKPFTMIVEGKETQIKGGLADHLGISGLRGVDWKAYCEPIAEEIKRIDNDWKNYPTVQWKDDLFPLGRWKIREEDGKK
jgi:hypothetical protein